MPLSVSAQDVCEIKELGGQCGFGQYCLEGWERDIPDTDTHFRFECVGFEGGAAVTCEYEKALHLSQFDGD